MRQTRPFSPSKELASFEDIWPGGYFEGNPLDPMASSHYGAMGYISVLHATYLCCIKPYVTPHVRVLEIGPGRGAWTKTMLGAREIWCLDALSAAHNGFWEYVGPAPHIHYVKVTDFSCSEVPDDTIDFLFSFGALVHVSFEGIHQYLRSLYPKLRNGANGFIMVGDYDQYRHALETAATRDIGRALGASRRGRPAGLLWRLLGGGRPRVEPPVDEDDEPRPGRWYHAGVERTCALLDALGYVVVDPDVGVIPRDPIIHFRKSAGGEDRVQTT